MCGIVGFASKTPKLDLKYLEKANEILSHRGPDQNGTWISEDKHVSFAHQRLSILDTSLMGSQPMISHSRRYTIIFNGEIYNHLNLRSKLNTKFNINWKSNCDTETLLNSIEFFGIKNTLKNINGMFAFSIYDSLEKKLFLARDRAGEKPLFFYRDKEQICFSSELKALMCKSDLPRRINHKALNCYLSFGRIPRELCILEGYSKLQAGNFLEYNVSTGKVNIQKYWEIPDFSGKYSFEDDENLLEELEFLLEDSVRQQMIADVPVGILLSGGLDSSIITALAARNTNRINTFNISFPDHEKFDESKHALLVSNKFNTNHTELPASNFTPELISELAIHFDEPLGDSSMLPTFMISNLISNHCKVALGGDGGDELFGGYSHYQNFISINQKLKFFPKILRHSLNFLSKNLLPLGFKGRNFLNSIDYDNHNELPMSKNFFDAYSRLKLIDEELFKVDMNVQENDFLKDEIKYSDLVQRFTRNDFKNYLCDDILVKVDRASMLSSLEMRSPFLDKRIIEFAFSKVPSNLKVTKNRKKILLKKLAKKLLPLDFDFNRKQGFSIPLDSISRNGKIHDFFCEILGNSNSIYNQKLIKSMLKNHLNGYANGERLFLLIQFQIWKDYYKAYF